MDNDSEKNIFFSKSSLHALRSIFVGIIEKKLS